MSRSQCAGEPPQSIVIEADLPHPPAKVWRALTQPELLAAWLGPNDIRPAVGARFRVQPGAGEEIDCEVVEVRHERRLSFTWRIGETAPTVVTFELRPAGAGTAFRLAHTGFPLASSRTPRALASAAPVARLRPHRPAVSGPARPPMRWAA